MTEQPQLDPIACFLTACEIERREHRSSGREHTVVQGRRILAEDGRFFYKFSTSSDLSVKELCSVQLIVSSALYSALVTAKAPGSITVSLGVDLGPLIPTARLEGEETDLLQTLIHRLKGLKRGDSDVEFNTKLATQLLRLQEPSAVEAPPMSLEKPPEDLTADQRIAFSKCLSQPLTFLWGPPGTGKTTLLGALAWQLYRENKRVLIVSHTNQAVDGVLESLCRRVSERGRSALPEGSILRLGVLVKESLVKQYADQVQLDSVMNRSHDKVSTRLESLKAELAEVRAKLFESSKKLTLLDSYVELHGELQKLKGAQRSEGSGLVHAVRKVFQPTVSASEVAPSREEELRESISLLESNLAQVTAELQGCERAQLAEVNLELSNRQLEITEAIALLEKFVRDLRISLLDRARVVATTATQALLSARDLRRFDVVLVDEASMLPLPLCYLLGGLARQQAVVAGDFRQLPSIASSDSHMVNLWYTRDVFDCAGVIDHVDAAREHPAIATLTTQFRSCEPLCTLINERFYGGRLVSHPREDSPLVFKEPLTYLNRHPIVLVDTSPLEPRGHTHNSSKSNLLHALIVRKIALSLSAAGLGECPEGVGVITPYRRQVHLIKELLDECSIDSISVGTVHRFQGSERDAIILDLTDSAPHRLGTFLGPRSLRDTGARLLNVALSRARRYLFVVANLAHLRQQLSSSHILSGILNDLERLGHCIPVGELIGEPLLPNPELSVDQSSGVLAFQSFDQQLFLPALVTDLLEAKEDVVISTPRVAPREVAVLASLLEDRIQAGLRVTIIVDGAANLDIDEQRSLKGLRDIGVLVVKSLSSPLPFVVVDSEVVWVGSIAPGACLSGEPGLMARSVSGRACSILLELHNAESRPISRTSALAG
jgi:energy-coupling factor transporter ATP-binding protein EcfA2